MTFFSRCDQPPRYVSSQHPVNKRRMRHHDDVGAYAALAGFAEDIGILFRYAMGLDYYGRHRLDLRD